ncbi:MAG: seryl-tRNA synthetase [Candidatus Parcubacteria bacterium]|jgi:seryl-tRNA synthetase|nr:seryl-tRNA synthetase [Candidatus Parcubacteria bacterium]
MPYNGATMLDIHFIRENADLVKAGAAKKKVDVDVDRLLRVDDERKVLRQQMDDKKAEQNRMSGTIQRADGLEREKLIEQMRHVKEGFAELETKFNTLTDEWTKLMLAVPNLPSPDTPEGPDESGNVVVREWGKKPQFSFTPKPHWDIGEALDLIDTQKAAEVSGARFAYLKGDAVLLQFALVQLVFKILGSEETLKNIAVAAGLDINTRPFVPVVPPMMMRADVMGRMARLHPIEERYYFEKDELVFIGSAEHTLGPLHMNETIDESQLPVRYVGYSTSFRREAGTYGKDTRGILRLHQFDKIEMETFARPEDGFREQDFLVAIQEHLMQQLGLSYQVMAICTGDMGNPDQRQFDINTWMPGQDAYRETHTSDYIGGYQARRLNTRVRSADGELTHVHMNDATAFAIGRTLIAIIENYQQEDGTVRVPEALVPYVGKEILGRTA